MYKQTLFSLFSGFFLVVVTVASFWGFGASMDEAFKKMLDSKHDIQIMRYFDQQSRLIELEKKVSGDFSYFVREGELRKPIISANEVSSALRQLSGFATGKIVFGLTVLGPKWNSLLFQIGLDLFIYSFEKESVQRLTYRVSEKSLITYSEDENFILWVEDGDIWLCDAQNSFVNYRLTERNSTQFKNGVLAWVYEEEIFGRGQPIGYWLSPSQDYVAFLQTDESAVEKFPLVDYTQLEPKPQFLAYPKAGGVNPKVKLAYVSIRGGEPTFVDLGSHAFSDYLISGVGFSADGLYLFYQIQDRIQSKLALYSFSLKNHESKQIWYEESENFVHRLQEAPRSLGENRYLWHSAESGYAHLYKLQIVEGLLAQKEQLTSGFWDVGDVLYAAADKIIFSSRKDEITENHLYSLENADLKRLSDLGANYRAEISKDGNKALMVKSQFNRLSKTVLKYFAKENSSFFMPQNKRLDEIAKTLEENALYNYEYISYQGQAQKPLKAILLKPSSLEPDKKYPLIVHTYSGPHNPITMNRISEQNFWNQLMAGKGYFVLICDSSSAQLQGHDILSRSYQKLGQLELEDIHRAIDFTIEQNSEIDTKNIGIWGWSFGGYMAAFALTHSSRFKAGAAIAPVTDWRLYDSVYTERYMNTPQANLSGYNASSVLCAACNLKGRLLLMHGAMDDNVHEQNSINLAFELSKNGILFDMMSYAQSAHGMNRGVLFHLYAKLEEFFKVNLRF